ncbi:hypothetical protein MS5N3_36710 [Marinobacter salsuginis]|uniref:Uncharacterized protein n=1 Tax=Marinobacter salsuginis TaxID=418719 RepID=A0A5M3PTH7_9GAMM|nr:hypothetical protein MS5N3_36710 [Marinobacter salsuginis]
MKLESFEMNLVTRNGLWCVVFEGDLGEQFQKTFGSNVVPLPIESSVPRSQALEHLERHKDSLSMDHLFPAGNSR